MILYRSRSAMHILEARVASSYMLVISAIDILHGPE